MLTDREVNLIIAEQNKNTEEILKTVEKVKSDVQESLKSKEECIKQLEQEKCELLGIIQGKDTIIKELEETIRKGTSCGDWNDDVHACQMYLKHEELQEYIYQLTEAKEIIQKLCNWVSGRSGDDLELLEQAEKFVEEV